MRAIALPLQKPLRQRIQDYVRRLMSPLAADEQISVSLAKSDVVAATAENWYDGVAAAWQPKGAANLLASYLRIAGYDGYDNVDPDIIGAGVAPGFDISRGWIGGGGAWLESGLYVSKSWTMLVRFANGIATPSTSALCGIYQSTTFRMYIQPYYTGVNVRYASASVINRAPGLTSGVLAIAGQQPYRNGVLDGAEIPDTWSGSAAIPVGMLSWSNGDNAYPGDILGIGFWDSILDAATIAAKTALLAAI